jgi:NFU1 iron-sulfur cluster scaffold homolog, mitochondrial
MLNRALFRFIFIRTQATPNPAFLQFFPGVILLKEGSLDFSAPRQAQNYPLAIKLFQIDGVTRVFIAKDYISIGKSVALDWSMLKPLVFEVLMAHLSAGEAMIAEVEPSEDTKILETDSKDMAMVKEIIEFRIRPFVRDDGGDVRLVEFDENTGKVVLEMRGSCSGCPNSANTLKNGIEKMLCYYVKSVKTVEAIDS